MEDFGLQIQDHRDRKPQKKYNRTNLERSLNSASLLLLPYLTVVFGKVNIMRANSS